jgi:P pilus assembly chaperone PapD
MGKILERAMEKRRQKSLIFIVMLFFIFAIAPLESFSLNPGEHIFNLSKIGDTRSFKLDNNSLEPIAVEIYMKKRDMDIDGKEFNPEIDGEFLFYPEQVILMPMESQIVNVVWLGGIQSERELAYRLYGEELPLDLNEEEEEDKGVLGVNTKIKILLRYAASVYVTPKKTEEEVVVEELKAQLNEEGVKQLMVTLYNKGSKHVFFSKNDLHIKDSRTGKNIYTSKDIKPFVHVNLLAGKKVRFFLEYPEGVEERNLVAEFVTLKK